ncbi:MAG: YlxM family DNA-binding protein [Halanaerobiaceae bacterium]|jgi:predicted DNA-binding protein YlxM (UPF0122 family)|nr:YlxM family DNA-binding protein [Halanaerobiaceae bacterium]
MLDKVVEIGVLYDFYGELLTEKQQKAIELYYFQDLSLGEIAEKLEISRQGVYDHIHRAEEILRDYECRLGLIEKHKRIKNAIGDLEKYIKERDLSYSIKKGIIEKLENVKKNI